MSDPLPIDVLDTSALVESKRAIVVSAQWAAFKVLEQRVAEGLIAMPRQVIKEVTAIAHADIPGAWAPGMRSQLRHPIDVGYEFVARVMTVAGEVVDASATGEEADPYVLALALCLRDRGHAVRVVTEDSVDRLPLRISLCTDCDRFGVPHLDVRTFLCECGISVKGPDG